LTEDLFRGNAFINALSLRSRSDVQADGGQWGRLVENAVGAHLLCGLSPTEFAVTYWRDGSAEVDFVVTAGKRTWAIEVKSGRAGRLSGMAAFRKRYPKAEAWLIGADGVPLAEFFGRPVADWFR
jgi:predicted AAA+ superfamily ATPase